MSYTRDEVFDASLKYFCGDDLAADVFVTKYALQDKDGNFMELDPDDMHVRLAKEFRRIEEKYKNPLSYEEIYRLLKGFKYVVPQGSPMSGIGNPYQIQSISNCFVIDSPFDSYGGILKTDQEQVQIMKRRGGVGFDISTIRPKGLKTSNSAKTTDGIGVFMQRFSNSTREVAQGGRRGALIITIDCHHPEIRTFINIKKDLKKVTGANLSIRMSDEFMEAVKHNKKVQLRFPVEKGVEHVVDEFVDANDLWNEIVRAAWECGEPGIMFWDTMIRNTPSDCYAELGFASKSTNPCAELVLSPYDSCRLTLVNLVSFVKKPFAEDASFDFVTFADVVTKAQRLMDDMVDLELECIDRIIDKICSDPEPDDIKQPELLLWKKVREMGVNGRRTGLGITGLGDMLASLNIRYGTDESIEMTDNVYRLLAISSYKSSCTMAAERGSFPVFSHKLEHGHPFLTRIIEADPELKKLYEQHGRRNIANITTAPAGSVSVLTQTTSGIEPVYKLEYKRRRKINTNDKQASVDFIDELGDRWQEYVVLHHGLKRWIDATGKTAIEESPYWKATSAEIDWKKKIELQAVAQKWICHCLSNTNNLPADVSIDVVRDVYALGWELGCKGVTVYRDGSRSGVLVDVSTKKNDFIQHNAPKRPDELVCDIHRVTIKGEAWTILVGLYDNRPYELFGGLSQYVEIPKKYKQGIIHKHPRKTARSIYDLKFGDEDDMVVIRDIVNVFANPTHGAFTRTISLALRHGAPVQYVVEQLLKDELESDMFSFSRVTSRVLKTYITNGTKTSVEKTCPSCKGADLRYQEGCVSCSCGWSKCG